MLPGKTYSSNEIGRIIGRHWWLLVLPFVIGLTAGVVVYKQIPVRYKSETLITVVPQRVPEAYVRNAITTRIEDRLPAISDQILSRSSHSSRSNGRYCRTRSRPPRDGSRSRVATGSTRAHGPRRFER